MIRPADRPRDDARLLVVDATRDARVDASFDALPRFVERGDVVVVNDAATLPASRRGRTPGGAESEARLLPELDASARVRVVVFGAGDHRTPTEHRRPPPPLGIGDELRFGALSARVAAIDPGAPRLVDLVFDRAGDRLATALYEVGRPIQYAHGPDALPLWAVQTLYASRPWAVEMPSAGRPLRAATILALRARGAVVVAITHGAGLSSTGDPRIDEALPFPERWEISSSAARAIGAARRVIAIGTSVVRALEGCAAAHGEVRAGAGVTDLRLGPGTRRRVVDAVVTGLHEPGTSHFDLLEAFADRAVLERALAHAESRGYLGHELGDAALVIGRPVRAVAGVDSPRGDPSRRGAHRRRAVQAG